MDFIEKFIEVLPLGDLEGLSWGFIFFRDIDSHVADVGHDFAAHDVVEPEGALLVFLEVERGEWHFVLVECDALTQGTTVLVGDGEVDGVATEGSRVVETGLGDYPDAFVGKQVAVADA